MRALGVDPALDRDAARDDILLANASSLPGRDPELLWTRSTPVTSSVTGCSTWSLVFISRK